jgi:hypothetical protein
MENAWYKETAHLQADLKRKLNWIQEAAIHHILASTGSRGSSGRSSFFRMWAEVEARERMGSMLLLPRMP